MELKKITIGKRVSAISTRNQTEPRRGVVSAINHTSKGAFIEITEKDGRKFQTRPAYVS